MDRGVRVSQQEGELELERVGVLELVEQDAAVPLVEGCPHGVADDGVGEQVAGDDQQVVEDQGPCMASLGGGLERGSHQIGEETSEHGTGRGPEERVPEIPCGGGGLHDGRLVVAPHLLVPVAPGVKGLPVVVVGEDADRVGLVDGAVERGLGVSDSGQPDPELVVLVDVIPV